jgi:hypothetical protein
MAGADDNISIGVNDGGHYGDPLPGGPLHISDATQSIAAACEEARALMAAIKANGIGADVSVALGPDGNWHLVAKITIKGA